MNVPDRLTRPLPRRTLLRLLRGLGWSRIRQGKGNHVIWESPCGARVVLPGGSHSNMRIGNPYLRQINQANGLQPACSRGRSG